MLTFGTMNAFYKADMHKYYSCCGREEIAMKNETMRTGMKMGATIGGLAFLVVGIAPGFYFGSYGTLILLQQLMSGPVEPTLFVRAAIVMGIVAGLVSAAAVCVAVGGLLGMALGYVVSAPSEARKHRTAH